MVQVGINQTMLFGSIWQTMNKKLIQQSSNPQMMKTNITWQGLQCNKKESIVVDKLSLTYNNVANHHDNLYDVFLQVPQIVHLMIKFMRD